MRDMRYGSPDTRCAIRDTRFRLKQDKRFKILNENKNAHEM
jgi:hypothetical protein